MSHLPVPKPHDPPRRTLEVEGYTLAYTVEGPPDAPSIVLLHGIPGGVTDFRYLGPQLEGPLRVIRLDFPGFGGSSALPMRDWSPRGRAALVAGFAAALGLDRFAVLGHSMGGAVALATAALYPERVNALILLASVGVRRHRALFLPPAMIRGVAWMTRVPVLRDYLVRNARHQYRRMRFPNAERLGWRELHYQFQLIGALSFEQQRRHARMVSCPSLIVIAKDDHLVEPSIGRELATLLPSSELLEYPTGGHNLQKGQAIDLARRIQAFLKVVPRAESAATGIEGEGG